MHCIDRLVFCIRAIWFNMIGIGALLLMCSYAGLVIFAFYNVHKCDPIEAEVICPLLKLDLNIN